MPFNNFFTEKGFSTVLLISIFETDTVFAHCNIYF